MTILVTGGAGYIGSHTVRRLLKEKKEIVVLDNLSTGHRQAVGSATFYEGDIADNQLIKSIIHQHKIDSVIHFAAHSIVHESMENPHKYYYNNVIKSVRLLDLLIENGVEKLVFSSTAAVYGKPVELPISEEAPLKPTNVYGRTKLIVEEIIKDYSRAYGLRYIILRYFNAAGADESGDIGEDHSPESHLIPLILQVALGNRKKISIYGEDYDTPDGSCIRDYIHVNDLAMAHLLALEALTAGKASKVYNLGNGKGFSVKEVIRATERVVGRSINQAIEGRRQGDPHCLIASSYNVQKDLGWRPEYTNIDDIISTAWKWHHSHPKGFEAKVNQ